MEINGREIAQAIYDQLQQEVAHLALQKVIPHMVVLLIGENPSSLSYIRQKKKWAEYIGAKLTILPYDDTVSDRLLLRKIEELNNDPTVHGIIIQLPLPPHLPEQTLTQAVVTKKDIDGFKKDSPFAVPIAQAILFILEVIHPEETLEWIRSQQVVVIGEGKTAGEPIITFLREQGVSVNVIHHDTPNPQDLMREADILLSCVGKRQIVTADSIKQGVILLGVGIHTEEEGLKGDYEVEEIKEKAAYYTPTPGGVGPVNVACLLSNLVEASKNE